MRRFYRLRNGCLICRILARQRVDSARRVMDTPQLVAYCPFASSFPYEVWITPRKHLAAFDRSDDSLVAAAGQLVQTILMRLEDQVPGIAYNYVIDTIPFDRTDDGHYHWHIRIMPRMARLAGLELATGVHVNIVPPEQAAARLRGG